MKMKSILFVTSLVTSLLVLETIVSAGARISRSSAKTAVAPADACAQVDAKACVALAVNAMGGQTKLQALQGVTYEFVANELIPEQSYRQDPFIAAYERATSTLDYKNGREMVVARKIWPEADSPQFEFTSTLVVTPDGGVHRRAQGDGPATEPEVEDARLALALGPGRLLQTADHAADLHFGASETLRSTLHSSLAFRWNGASVTILVNPFNHLPDAVEMKGPLHDFWSVWGDVQRRFYFDNWVIFQGIAWPTNVIEERNGLLWRSSQVLTLQVNPTVDEGTWKQDQATVAKPTQYFPSLHLDPSKATELAPGVTLYPGGWNTTLIGQPDGVYILEAPISPQYVAEVASEAKRRYAKPVAGVISTSDSWPHVAGVRGAVALGLPTYILDLNQPLLDRLLRAPHSMAPDMLTQTPRAPQWRVVAAKTTIGSGDNRLELYPLRGASTERQVMVYFPARRLLYASDTLAFNRDGSLYDPELMYEVIQAVTREHLAVETVFAMHEGPTPWSKVVALVDEALR
jgi:hypothetical protein